MNYIRYYHNPNLNISNNCFTGIDKKLSQKDHQPPMNIYENKEEFYVELAIPGYKKDEVEINLNQKTLKIRSKEEKNKKNSGEAIICRKVQFSKQAFSRSLQLPESINLKAINAIIEDGLLKIFLPKNKEAEMKQTRQIFIS